MSTPIYHITHIRNLPSILKSDGLMCNHLLQNQDIGYQDISYEDIQDRRARIQVPYGRGGTLHDYVPFYFAPRSPMLYAIHKRAVRTCPEGQTPILHLVTEVEIIEAHGDDYVFTDGHAIVEYSEFFNDPYYLSEIDWDVMEATYWNNLEEDPDRKRRRQAEFLVYRSVDWEVITEIGVINHQIRQQVEEGLQMLNQSTPVKVHQSWYY